MHSAFAPYESLAERLLPHGIGADGDGSHDVSHLLRVWRNASRLHAEEGGDDEILFAAAMLHDCVAVEKNSSFRPQASRLSAEKATRCLRGLGWSESRVAATTHAIEAHSFSAGIQPMTVEAKILQDADRLDAIGMIGVARCFYVAGRLGTALYDPADPDASQRPYDDERYAVDHFQTKLLKLASGFQTVSGARLAQERHERLRRFLADLRSEI
ncbi:HD domain-containing protein [Microvirga brassicacearum]|uniref:HD domain-containing protein n=1 Tax=Microvirga brassicacearum TaxID=2580413 RepID=A0A5N3P406_9HYPH|nr:HD domain-containing protein [Microvirga brassicacearum]KAB0264466.1 HD domain-containing protein [Microvirga brassicacearum]